MRETEEDLERLRAILDRSYAAAGPHLLSIHTSDRRLSAEQLVETLTGMRLLSLATVTADCRPIVGPVDGIFLRGSFHFGSAPSSLRAKHLRARPQVSATHLPGEELGVTVHGRAVPVDVGKEEGAELRETLLEISPLLAPVGAGDARRRRGLRGSKPSACSPSTCLARGLRSAFVRLAGDEVRLPNKA